MTFTLLFGKLFITLQANMPDADYGNQFTATVLVPFARRSPFR